MRHTGFRPARGLVRRIAPTEKRRGQLSYLGDSAENIGAEGEHWLRGEVHDPTSYRMNGVAGILKVEAYPLYGKGGPLRDLAFFADFGAGSMTVEGAPDDPADGGFTSVAGLGSAYELLRFSRFAVAPTAEYLFIRSATVTSHSAILGARVVFYGGPTGKPKVALSER